jgi:hypothetical protein
MRGPMHGALVALSIWITPGFLFVAWRVWMSRPLRDVHYRARWRYAHALVHDLRGQTILFRDGPFQNKNRPG